MANAQKVANIFELASVAFKKLADLTLDLKIFQAQMEQGPTTSSRWTIIEVEQLKEAVARFGNDLTKIAQMIETKTINQIKHKLKSQALEGPNPEVQEQVEIEAEKEANDFPEEQPSQVQELPAVSAVSVDRGRRKQTFSERSESEAPDTKRRRLDPGSTVQTISIPRPSGSLVSRPGVPVTVQSMPVQVQLPTPNKLRVTPITPSASNLLSHAAMRKQPVISQESKYEDYSDDKDEVVAERKETNHDEGEIEEEEEVSHYGGIRSYGDGVVGADDDDDDDDHEESDDPYYSEDEEGGGGGHHDDDDDDYNPGQDD